MFKVDNRHQNDIIDIFGRNMRGNIRSAKEKKTAKKKKTFCRHKLLQEQHFITKLLLMKTKLQINEN